MPRASRKICTGAVNERLAMVPVVRDAVRIPKATSIANAATTTTIAATSPPATRRNRRIGLPLQFYDDGAVFSVHRKGLNRHHCGQGRRAGFHIEGRTVARANHAATVER